MNFLFSLFRFWVFLLFGTLTGYIALTNNTNVTIHIPPFIESVTVQLYVALAAAFLAGAGVMVLFFGNDSLRKSWQVRGLNRKLQEFGADQPRASKLGRDQKQSPSMAPADFKGS